MENLKKICISHGKAARLGCGDMQRSSYKGRKENALTLGADERRGKLR